MAAETGIPSNRTRHCELLQSSTKVFCIGLHSLRGRPAYRALERLQGSTVGPLNTCRHYGSIFRIELCSTTCLTSS